MDDRLNLIIDDTGNYLVKTDALPIGKILGGLFSSYKQQWYMKPGSGKNELKKAFLEIGLITRRPEMSKWRVWFDGISLTRELHPNYSLKLPEGYYYTVVFDVTPIARRDPSKEKHKITVLNDGSEPLILVHSLMIKKYSSEKTHSSLKYISGGLFFAPGEDKEIKLDLNKKYKKTLIRILTYIDSSPSSISFSVNDEELNWEQTTKCDEILFTFRELQRLDIKIKNLNNISPSKKNWVLIPSIIAQGETRPSAIIELDEESLMKEDDNYLLKLNLKNKGDVTAENVMLVVFASGLPLKQLSMGNIDTGEKRIVSEKLVIPPESRTLLYRIIWQEENETVYIEKRLRIPKKV